MSTSFYWIIADGKNPMGTEVDTFDVEDPERHIGKRSSDGVGRPPRFIWATWPEIAGPIHGPLANVKCVVDEYGREYTGLEFAAMIAAYNFDYRHIGERFG